MKKFMKSILLLASLLIGINSTLFAQKSTNTDGEIRGFVYDKKTGEPIIFTNVFIEGTTLGVSTDINGFYALTKLKAGNYTVIDIKFSSSCSACAKWMPARSSSS